MQTETTVAPQNIRLAAIHVAPGHNPRKHFKQSEFDRLVESIRENDLLTPILVRPNPNGDGYELIAGERRLRAMRVLKRDEIPALVRQLDDVEARRAALIENIDRANLSVAEECLASQSHVDAYDGDHEAAAKALGWGLQKLKHRLRLLHCAPDVMQALVEERLTQAHAELLATLPVEAQLKALPRILDQQVSVADLKEQLHGFATPLAQAIFDREAAGCGTCQYNSETQRSLFSTHIGEARCTNRPCYTAKTTTALEAKRATLREEFGTVVLLTEKVPGSMVPLVIHGEAGVGAAQFAKCRGCAFRGAVVDDRLGTTTGRVDQPMCFNRSCNSERIAEHRETLNPPSDPAADAQDAPTPSTAHAAKRATQSPSKGAAAKKAPAKAAAKATPAAVADQHAGTVRRALSARLQTDPTLVLSLALYGLLRAAAEETGREGIEAVMKEVGIAPPKGKSASATHTLIPASLAKMEKPALQQAIVATAALMFDRNADEMPFHRKINRRSLAAMLVDHAQIDLMPYVRVDADFLAAHTKAALEDVLDESGFTAWLKAQPDGEKRLRALLAGSKGDLVKGVLDAGYPGFTSYLPSALTDQAATWRKNP